MKMETDEKKLVINAKEVAHMMGVSQAQAYVLIRRLNTELEKKGYITVRGKVNRKYLHERMGN